MAGQEGFPTSRDLFFYGTNHAFWRIRMWTSIMALGFDIWQLFVTSYTPPTTQQKYATEKKYLYVCEILNVILHFL